MTDWQKTLDGHFADERAFAGKMSDAAKFLWAGTLALFYGAMFADRGALADFFRLRGGWLWLAAECGAAAFLLDLTRSWAGLALASEAQTWLEANWAARNDANFAVRYRASLASARRLGLPLRRLNRAAFALSVAASLAAAALVCGAIAAAYLAPSPSLLPK